MRPSFDAFSKKMETAGQSSAAINAFARNYELLLRGETALIPEDAIAPARDLPTLEEIRALQERGGTAAGLLDETVVIKLNGGLGTGMGLEKAKSLIVVRDGLTFLDLIARQTLGLRERFGSAVRFLLMNSFSTSADTLRYLEKYPELGGKEELELMQSRVPKIDAQTRAPAAYPAEPGLEWCPPGHGDLYPSLLGTGWLDRLLAQGVKYAFVSNSDNLGATMDLDLLSYFAESGKPFLMEVTARTGADRKGGHLAVRTADGAFVLRESAQCPKEDAEYFQDVARHSYFNTNNLWFRLDRLKEVLDGNGGILPLPMIVNEKNVNPRDKNSASVIQLETAMGSAIECFPGAGAIDVPRNRFAPVKTTEDLLALRSDAYEITENFKVQLAEERAGIPPVVHLDEAHYKMLDRFEEAVRGGAPSLRDCRTLTVRGPVRFSAGAKMVGDVIVENGSEEPVELPAGTIEDTTVIL